MDSLIQLLELATQTTNKTPKVEEDENPSVLIRWGNEVKKIPITTQSISSVQEQPVEPEPKSRKSRAKKTVEFPSAAESNKPRERYQRFREKKFVCEDCSHSFTLKHNLKVHREKYHDTTNPRELMCNRRIPCPTCGELFRTKSEIKKHANQEHKEKRPPRLDHACDQCDRVYSTARQVREHIVAMHLNERLYICELCGTSFGRPGGLRRHLVMVHTDYTFKCPFDGCTHPGYKCSKALAAHVRSVHTKERPYVCTICEKSFIRRNDLKVHEETHDPSSRFRCEFCKSDFKRLVYFKKHLRRCKKCPGAAMARRKPEQKSDLKEEWVDEDDESTTDRPMTLSDLVDFAESMDADDAKSEEVNDEREVKLEPT